MYARPALRMLAAAVLLSAAGTARADMVSFSGSRTGADPVSFSGSLAFNPTTSNVLTITLKNTTPTNSDAASLGFITGFGFNLPTGVTAGSPKVSDSDFKLLNAKDHSTGLQGGEFDYAFSTNGSQLHSVARSEISKGIGANGSATFTVALSGNLTGLTAAQIFDEMSKSPTVPFSVRFRSTNNNYYSGQIGDGDKVVAKKDPTPPTNPVPAPPGVALAAIGFGTLLLGRLRRRAA